MNSIGLTFFCLMLDIVEMFLETSLETPPETSLNQQGYRLQKYGKYKCGGTSYVAYHPRRT